MTPGARSNAVRWGALAVGIVLFAAALYYINISLAVGTIRRLGVALPLALLFSGLWHLVRTWAWSWCFPPDRNLSFLRLARVRLAAEASGVPEVRAEERQVTLKWARLPDRREVTLALQVAGFRPDSGSNQVRIPVAVGRDPVDVALRALTALTQD